MREVSLGTVISQMKLLHFDPNPNGHKSSKDDPKIPPKLSLGPLGTLKVLQICWNGTLQTDHLAMAVFEG